MTLNLNDKIKNRNVKIDYARSFGCVNPDVAKGVVTGYYFSDTSNFVELDSNLLINTKFISKIEIQQ